MHHFFLPHMSCAHCVAAITEAIRNTDPAAQTDIDRDAKKAAVISTLPRDALAAALTEAGYPPAPQVA